jgi:hypothetical protein
MSRLYAAIGLLVIVAGAWWAWTDRGRQIEDARKAQATAEAALAACEATKAGVEASAAACSAATEEAATLSAQRARQAQEAVASAQARANTAERRAADLLRRRPSDPGDLCRSADVMLTEWIRQRREGRP